MGNWIPDGLTLVAQLLKISAAYSPPPPDGFVSPMAWGVEAHVAQRFADAGIRGDRISFARDTYTFEAPVPPEAFVRDLRTYYGPTMSAFAAAARSGRSEELRREVEALVQRQNQSPIQGTTSIPATWTLISSVNERYQRPMDDVARNRHATAMNTTFASHASHVAELAGQPIAILPPIAEAAVPIDLRPATKSLLTSTTSPTDNTLPGEPTAGEGVSSELWPSGPLRNASTGRLACLFRHWTWANEAMAQFERELAADWDYGDDPLADHPFGAYYHWCALLCGFSEAALDHALLSESQLESLRADLEASLPGLRVCRQLLVVIPATFEEHSRIVDLLHDHETLGRLRRMHSAFGAALREEHLSRQLEWLLYEH